MAERKLRKTVSGITLLLLMILSFPPPGLSTEAVDLVSTRIVNGSDVASAPAWMASLHDTGYPPTDIKRGHICGAVLIHREYLLTSGHCADFYKNDPAKLSATLGRARLSDVGGVTRTIKAITIHPGFNPASDVIRNDLAVLQLSEAVDAEPLAILPKTANHPSGGTNAQIYGWGRLAQIGASYSNVLQRATIKIQSDALCQSNLGDFFEVASMTCAGTLASAPGATDGVDACGGDSGGPLIANVTGVGARLVGLVSWQLGNCASHQYYTAYTRLKSFTDWIANQLPPTSNPPPVDPGPDPDPDESPTPKLGKPRLQKIGLSCNGAQCHIEIRALAAGKHELSEIAAIEVTSIFQRKSCTVRDGKGTCRQEDLDLPLQLIRQTTDHEQQRPRTVANYTFTAPGTGLLLIRANAIDQADNSSVLRRGQIRVLGPNGVAAFDQSGPVIRQVQGSCTLENCDLKVTVFDRTPSAGGIVVAATNGSIQRRLCTTVNSRRSCSRVAENFSVPVISRIDSEEIKRGILETFRLVIPTSGPGIVRLQLQATDAAGQSSRILNVKRTAR